MKILYNQIKKFVPQLKATPQEVGEILTYTGFMLESIEEVKIAGQKDFLLSLEIRQNRADCFGVIGLAREVAVYYGLELVLPFQKKYQETKDKLKIKIEDKNKVKSILAIKIDNLKNQKSPQWLKNYLESYGMKSINLLVDISNYVMIVTGYPSHLIDSDKVKGAIFWKINNSFTDFKTLDNSIVSLNKDELIIQDKEKIIALAGIVGGRTAEVSEKTKNIIVEMAVYNRVIIGKNSRSLHITTEASSRLEKELDPFSSDYAMDMLVNMILEYSGGKISSQLFKYFQSAKTLKKIKFNLNLPSVFAGIEISSKIVLNILKNFKFKIIKIDKDNVLVEIPSYRTDLELPADLVEEITRIFGFQKIPVDELPALKVTKNITPPNILLADKMRDILTHNGFDEILSWPLTKKGDNKKVNYLDWQSIIIQNLVNELYPDLRQSMASGLLNQLKEFNKNNVDLINIYEIGKVFGKKNNQYLEHESLGVLATYSKKNFNSFKERIENLLRSIGLLDIKYKEAKNSPQIANNNSCFNIFSLKKKIGIFYKLKPQKNNNNIYFAELNITEITQLIQKNKNKPAVEIIQKLIVLDANIQLSKEENIYEYLEDILKKINFRNIWAISVEDSFPLGDKIKYTIRVVYKGLSDQMAKNIHLKSFDLISL